MVNVGGLIMGHTLPSGHVEPGESFVDTVINNCPGIKSTMKKLKKKFK